MNILIYIEPVIYQNDALFLSPHCNFARCFIQANSGSEVNYAIATSPWLIENYHQWVKDHGGPFDLTFYPLNPKNYLRQFDFETNRYSVDLFEHSEKNKCIIEDLVRIRDAYAPDVIICSTENSYIRSIFSKSTIIHHDLSHIVRNDGVYNLFFDSSGHSKTSILNSCRSKILEYPIHEEETQEILSVHNGFIFESAPALDQRKIFRTWLKDTKAADSKIALIALQHSRHVVVEGAYKGKTSDAILMEAAESLPAGWIGVITYHPSDREIARIAPYIAACFDNLLLLPEDIAKFRSDALIPEVDAIVSVNSKVGLLGLLCGKTVISLGYSAYYSYCSQDIQTLEAQAVLSIYDRARIIKFMSNRYYFTFDEIFNQNNFMLSRIHQMREATTPTDWQVNIENWDINCLERLLGRKRCCTPTFPCRP